MPIDSEHRLGGDAISSQANLSKLATINGTSVDQQFFIRDPQFSKSRRKFERYRIRVTSIGEADFDFEPDGRLRASNGKIPRFHEIADAIGSEGDLLQQFEGESDCRLTGSVLSKQQYSRHSNQRQLKVFKATEIVDVKPLQHFSTCSRDTRLEPVST